MGMYSALALACCAGVASAGGPLETAHRLLQDDSCSPTDSELGTVLNIVMAQQTKLEAQAAAVACLTGCMGGGSCTCDGGISGGTGPPAPAPGGSGSVNGGMTININSDFAAALGDSQALDDCYITPEEIAADPEAAALAEQLRAVLAAQLGVDPSQVEMSGFSTDGDNIPGCADTPAVGHALDVTVDPDYANALGSDSAFADCYLSSEEIATDPEAAAFAEAFIAQTAAELGVDPSSIVLNGISTDGDTTPGCNAESGRRLQEASTTSVANPQTVELLRSLADTGRRG